MQKPSFRFMLLIMLFFNSITLGYAQSPEIIAQKTKASTVLLEIKDASGRASQGSGFFVGDRIVATNYHVINGAKTGTAKLVSRKIFSQQKPYELEGGCCI